MESKYVNWENFILSVIVYYIGLAFSTSDNFIISLLGILWIGALIFIIVDKPLEDLNNFLRVVIWLLVLLGSAVPLSIFG